MPKGITADRLAKRHELILMPAHRSPVCAGSHIRFAGPELNDVQPASHVAISEYITRFTGHLNLRETPLCSKHAKVFATNFNLELPE